MSLEKRFLPGSSSCSDYREGKKEAEQTGWVNEGETETEQTGWVNEGEAEAEQTGWVNDLRNTS